jgi:hypothetical protein
MELGRVTVVDEFPADAIEHQSVNAAETTEAAPAPQVLEDVAPAPAGAEAPADDLTAAETTAAQLAAMAGAKKSSPSFRSLVGAALALPTTLPLLVLTKWQNRQLGSLQAFLEHAGPLAKIVAKTGQMLEHVGGLQNAVRMVQLGKMAISSVLQVKGLVAPATHMATTGMLSEVFGAVDEALAENRKPQQPAPHTIHHFVLTADVTHNNTPHADATPVGRTGGQHDATDLLDGGNGSGGNNGNLIPDDVLDNLSADDRKFALDAAKTAPLPSYVPGTSKGTLGGQIMDQLHTLGYSHLGTAEQHDIINKTLHITPDPKHPGKMMTWESARNMADGTRTQLPNNGSLIAIVSEVTAEHSKDHRPTMPVAGSAAAQHIAHSLETAGQHNGNQQGHPGTTDSGGPNTDGKPPKTGDHGAGAVPTSKPSAAPSDHPSPSVKPSHSAASHPSPAPHQAGAHPSHPHPSSASPDAAPAAPHIGEQGGHDDINSWLLTGGLAGGILLAGAGTSLYLLKRRYPSYERASERLTLHSAPDEVDHALLLEYAARRLREGAARRAQAQLDEREAERLRSAAPAAESGRASDDDASQPLEGLPAKPRRREVAGDMARGTFSVVAGLAKALSPKVRREGTTVEGGLPTHRKRRVDLGRTDGGLPVALAANAHYVRLRAASRQPEANDAPAAGVEAATPPSPTTPRSGPAESPFADVEAPMERARRPGGTRPSPRPRPRTVDAAGSAGPAAQDPVTPIPPRHLDALDND